MADLTIDKTPTQNQSVNKPESGTYGERAEVDRLKKELPSTQGPGGPPGGAPVPERATPTTNKPPTSLGPEPGEAGPAGLPNVLMHQGSGNLTPQLPPEQRPPGAANLSQARIALLDALSSSQDVSTETREWAQIVLEMLIDASQPG